MDLDFTYSILHDGEKDEKEVKQTLRRIEGGGRKIKKFYREHSA